MPKRLPGREFARLRTKQSADFLLHSFRSSNSNHQDFIPHLRYLPRNDRFQTAFEVRGRRDQWLKAMFEGARQAIGRQELPHKPVVQLMLADDQNGLTDCESFTARTEAGKSSLSSGLTVLS